MIIQHFDFHVRDLVGDVYGGTTYFGFFSKGRRFASLTHPEDRGPLRGGTQQHLRLLHEVPFVTRLAMARDNRLHVQRLDLLERAEPLPRVRFLHERLAFVEHVVTRKHHPLLWQKH